MLDYFLFLFSFFDKTKSHTLMLSVTNDVSHEMMIYFRFFNL
jgi:hypothetical protein